MALTQAFITYACYCYFPILFILIFMFYALIILFPLFLGFYVPPLLNPNLFSKLPPQCFRFEFQSNAAVSSEAAASFLYIEARQTVLHLNAECTGWLCRTFRIKRELLHILSLSSPGPIFLGSFHNVVFKRGSHENIQDWV